MKVKVRAFGRLSAFLGNEIVVELEPDARLEDLLSKLRKETDKLQKESLARYDRTEPELTILINGRNILTLEKLRTSLKDGDQVVLLPPVYGG